MSFSKHLSSYFLLARYEIFSQLNVSKITLLMGFSTVSPVGENGGRFTGYYNPFENDPASNPYSMLGYDFGALSHDQKRELNALKINTIREDHIYLATHPEVRAVVSLLLRAFCNIQPRNIHEFASCFIRQPHLRKMVADFVENEVAKNEAEEKNVKSKLIHVGKGDSLVDTSPVPATGYAFRATSLTEALFPSSQFTHTPFTSQEEMHIHDQVSTEIKHSNVFQNADMLAKDMEREISSYIETEVIKAIEEVEDTNKVVEQIDDVSEAMEKEDAEIIEKEEDETITNNEKPEGYVEQFVQDVEGVKDEVKDTF